MKNLILLLTLSLSVPAFSADIVEVNQGQSIQASKINEIITSLNSLLTNFLNLKASTEQRVALEIEGYPSTTSLPINATTYLRFPVGAVLNDTNSAYNPLTGEWTCPVTDYYIITSSIFVSGGYGQEGFIDMLVSVDNVTRKAKRNKTSSSAGTLGADISVVMKINQGQKVKIGGYSGNWSTAPVVQASTGYNYMSIVRVR